MIIERGFVYKKDGKYLRTHESSNPHNHHTIGWVDSMESASVYVHDFVPSWVKDAFQGAEKIPVRVERIVTVEYTFNAQDIKYLRERYGCRVLDAHEALKKANGDKNKAGLYLTGRISL